jgi:thymidylate kinase
MVKLKKNYIISFMGVDGSGKTFLAKEIYKKIKNSQYLHLKPYIIIPDHRTVVKKPHLQEKSSFTISILRLFSWFISYKIFFYKDRVNKIFIFDRYANDILIDPLRYRHSLSAKFTKKILTLFPKPNLWIFLNPPFRTAKSRKNELQDVELKRQISEYSKFFRNKKNILVLNTRMPKKKLIKKILKKIKELVE